MIRGDGGPLGWRRRWVSSQPASEEAKQRQEEKGKGEEEKQVMISRRAFWSGGDARQPGSPSQSEGGGVWGVRGGCGVTEEKRWEG